MLISVVIPAYNEEESLPNTLDALVSQETRYPYEVVLIDNNSTDKTADIAKSYGQKLNIQIIKESQKGRGAARQRGFREAKGDIIASTDADTTVPTHWIESIGSFFEKDTSSVAITALCHYPSRKISVQLFNGVLFIAFQIFRLIFGNYWLSGFSFAIKRETYFEAGEFNSKIDAQEDSELSMRVSKLGKIEYVPALTVESSDRRFSDGLLRGLVPYIKTYYYMRQNNVRATKLDDKR